MVLVLLLCVAAGPIWAQSADDPELRRFRRANSLLQSGQVEKAISILEPLYQQAPDNAAFYRRLKEAYKQLKRYDDALRLVDDRLDEAPTPPLLSEKARLLYQAGRQDEAAATWTEALNLRPESPTTYRVVYRTLMDLRRYGRAIDVLTRAREELGRSSLFRTELAHLYSLDGQHGRAMSEYVRLLSGEPERVAFVRGRLQPFVNRGEGVDASVDTLRSAVEEAPLNPAYRELLAWLYMETDRYREAFDVYRALDRLQEGQGRRLFSFARKAADADRYDVATRAFELILERHPDAPVAPQAQRTLGETYRAWATAQTDSGTMPDTTGVAGDRLAAARAAYRAFLQQYPEHEAVPPVRRALGTLQLEVYRDLEAARATLQTVVSEHPDAPAASEARYDLARIALLRGDFSRARLLFSQLADDLRSGDLANRARFELAQLQFYRGAFDAARARAETVTAQTSADVANDAIALKVLIQENRGPDSLDTPLRLYARAQYRERQHRYDKAARSLDSLLQAHPRHALADEARFRQAHLHLVRGDTAAAQEAFGALPQRHPRSSYADRSLFRLGRLQEAQGDTAAAQSTYNQLLNEYPRSLLAGDVRSRLRALRRRG